MDVRMDIIYRKLFVISFYINILSILKILIYIDIKVELYWESKDCDKYWNGATAKQP